MAYTPTTWVDGSEPAITATRLNNMETGIYQAHELLDTVTSSATADALVKRDSAGRAQFAQGAAAGDAVVYPVPVTSLKRAMASFSPPVDAFEGTMGVPQYSFAGVHQERYAGSSAPKIYELGVTAAFVSTGRQWRWSKPEGAELTWTWEYLTASGQPRVWAEVDDQGEIMGMWEAEDPADPEWPDEPPIQAGDGRVVISIEPPDERLLRAVTERLERSAMPPVFARSIYAADPPPRAARAMLSRQLAERGLEEPHDIREALSIADRDRRYWYLQLYMRQASRLLHDHRASTLIPLYREMCRVDPTSGRLQLQ